MASRAETLYRGIERLSPAERTLQVEGWVTSQALEGDYLDFKRAAPKESDTKEIWSKALSGFANTEGGVVVWGIGTNRITLPGADRAIDAASSLSPLPHTGSFVQLLRDTQSDSTVEPLGGVEYLEVPATAVGGYVLCLVPEGPHRPYRDSRTHLYWQRIGDRFEVISHGILRGLFYPRSHPFFEVILDRATYGTSFRIDLVNRGNASADNVAVAFKSNDQRLQPTAIPPSRLILNQMEGVVSTHLFDCPQVIHPSQPMPLIRVEHPGTITEHTRGSLTIYSRDSDPAEIPLSLHPI